MSPVLPIDTQRYQSGDYTLEVTVHPSPLSQWSDRPVVRQLRFSLWLERPERKRLARGNQQQLMAMGDAVEAYVHRHLTQQAWPQLHRLQLLDKGVALSTLQLFDLAEVLSAYGQGQITLPAQRRPPSRRWWTGSVVASLMIAVGATTAYLHNRPAGFDQLATDQAATSPALESALEEAPEAIANHPARPGAPVESLPEVASIPEPERGAAMRSHAADAADEITDDEVTANATTDATLVAIAALLAPYQPTDATFPLVYYLQIAPDGTITAIEPITETAPAINIATETLSPPPRRPLQVDVIYTGDAYPIVNER